MFKPKYLAYAIGVWGGGGACAPVLGPLLGGFAYQAKGWTWPIWVLTWLSGSCLVLIIIFLPETSSSNVSDKVPLHLRRTHNRFSTDGWYDCGSSPAIIT